MFDLSDSVNQMSEEEMKTMTLQAFRRILTTESMNSVYAPLCIVLCPIMSTFTCSYRFYA